MPKLCAHDAGTLASNSKLWSAMSASNHTQHYTTTVMETKLTTVWEIAQTISPIYSYCRHGTEASLLWLVELALGRPPARESKGHLLGNGQGHTCNVLTLAASPFMGQNTEKKTNKTFSLWWLLIFSQGGSQVVLPNIEEQPKKRQVWSVSRMHLKSER